MPPASRLLGDLGREAPAPAPAAAHTRHALSLIASNARGDTFVLGVNNVLRHCCARRGGSAGGADMASEVLLTPATAAEKLASARITHLAFNPNGDRLLLSGPDIFAVVFLQPSAAGGGVWSNSKAEGDTAVVVLVDDAYHSTRGALLQVSWHPHCPYHLLSLTDPDVGGQQLRFYSATGHGVPPAMYQEGGLPPCDGAPLAAFAFGADHGWERFAVLAVRADGSAVCACPVLPRRCRLLRSQLSALLHSVVGALKTQQQQQQQRQQQCGGGGSSSGSGTAAEERDLERGAARLALLLQQERWLRDVWGTGLAAGAGAAAFVEANAEAVTKCAKPCWQELDDRDRPSLGLEELAGGGGAAGGGIAPSLTCLTAMTATGGAHDVPPTLLARCFGGTPEPCGYQEVLVEFLVLAPGALEAVFRAGGGSGSGAGDASARRRPPKPRALELKTVALELDGSACSGCAPLLLPDAAHGDSVTVVAHSRVVCVRAGWLRPALAYIACGGGDAAAQSIALRLSEAERATLVGDVVRADEGGVMGAALIDAASDGLAIDPVLTVLTCEPVAPASGAYDESAGQEEHAPSHLVFVNLEDKRANMQNESVATREIAKLDPESAFDALLRLSKRTVPPNPLLDDSCSLEVKSALRDAHTALVEPLVILRALQEEVAARAAWCDTEQAQVRALVAQRGAALEELNVTLEEQLPRRREVSKKSAFLLQSATELESMAAQLRPSLSPAEAELLAEVKQTQLQAARMRVTTNQYRRQAEALTAMAEDDGGVATLLGSMSKMAIGAQRKGRLTVQQRQAVTQNVHELGLKLEDIKRRLEQAKRLADMIVIVPS